jgi:hypothetical protein
MVEPFVSMGSATVVSTNHVWKKNIFIYLFIFAVLGLKLRAYTLSHSTSPFFCDGFFEIGSLELFAWAGFEPQSS